jgi:diguanylate cyclase (GGDEF)-like protein
MNLQESINAFQIAVSTALEQVVEAALSDDKTPLGNLLALEKFTSLVGTGGDNPDVVIFGDINDFHSFNRRYGQDAGDAAITHVGTLIKEAFVDQCQAKAFRRSGDEFVILLTKSQLEGFKTRVPAFASCSFSIEAQLRKTAISFGYTVSKGEIAFSDLMVRAEAACQVAKAKGDGVVIEWSEETERQAIKSIRGRCPHCEASITCYAPREAIPKDEKLVCCPCCGNSW